MADLAFLQSLVANASAACARVRSLQPLGLCGLLGLLGLSSVACGLPDYRLHIDSVPTNATTLDVIAYVYPERSEKVAVALPSISLSPELRTNNPELTDVTIAMQLQGRLAGQAAVFSVAARDKDGCIQSVGATEWAVHLTSGSIQETPLHLQEKSVHAAPGSCTAPSSQPVILSVERVQRGLWGMQALQLDVYGWNWQADPPYLPIVRSNGRVDCATDPIGAMTLDRPYCGDLRCAKDCVATTPIVPVKCVTDCPMKVSANQFGSSRSSLMISPLVSVNSTAANALLSGPMTVQLESRFTGLGAYTEK